MTYHDQREHRVRGRHREGPAHPGHQGGRRPVDRRPGQEDRRPRRAHPHQQDRARRPVRRHLHDHQPGSGGALLDTPIINQPQVAILGTGTVVKRPVVIDDANLGETIAVRHMVYLALTYDHRLVDGADAGRFLRTSRQRLESASSTCDVRHDDRDNAEGWRGHPVGRGRRGHWYATGAPASRHHRLAGLGSGAAAAGPAPRDPLRPTGLRQVAHRHRALPVSRRPGGCPRPPRLGPGAPRRQQHGR